MPSLVSHSHRPRSYRTPTAIATATKCLREIEAIKRIRRGEGKADHDFYLTPLGIHLSNLPVDARIGKVRGARVALCCMHMGEKLIRPLHYCTHTTHTNRC